MSATELLCHRLALSLPRSLGRFEGRTPISCLVFPCCKGCGRRGETVGTIWPHSGGPWCGLTPKLVPHVACGTSWGTRAEDSAGSVVLCPRGAGGEEGRLGGPLKRQDVVEEPWGALPGLSLTSRGSQVRRHRPALGSEVPDRQRPQPAGPRCRLPPAQVLQRRQRQEAGEHRSEGKGCPSPPAVGNTGGRGRRRSPSRVPNAPGCPPRPAASRPCPSW